MPRFITVQQPGGSGVGRAISEAAQAMWGDTLTPALKREKLYGLQRENVETGNLMNAFSNPGRVDINQVIPMGIGAGMDPTKLAEFILTKYAHTYGAKDPSVTNAWVGAGKAYGQSPLGFDEGLANDRTLQAMRNAAAMQQHQASLAQQRALWEQTPEQALIDGRPTFVPRSGVFAEGVQPILSNSEAQGTLLQNHWDNLPELAPQQQKVLGGYIDPKDTGDPQQVFQQYFDLATQQGMDTNSAKQFALSQAAKRSAGMSITSPDGTTIEMGGIPGLERPVRTELQQADISGQRLRGLINMAREVAQRDPTNFGLPGSVKGLVQDAGQLAKSVAVGMGYNGLEEALADAKRSAERNGLNPQLLSGIYDSTLPEIQTLSDLLVYAAAESLAGQSGRSVSDKDVAYFKRLVGDPRDWLSSQEKFLAKLNILEDVAGLRQDVTNQYLGRTPATQPQPAPVHQAPRIRRYNPATGQLE